MTSVRVLRVFTDARGDSGNPLGVVREAGDIAHAQRQAIAAELGYSETVFAALGRALVIEQGPGCLIEVRPLTGGTVELGGRVAEDASVTAVGYGESHG
jgi:hypothetical protein